MAATLVAACQPIGDAASLAEQITSDEGQELSPSVAPDGAIVFSRVTAPTNVDVYVVREGGTAVNLTPDSPANDVEPAFSPDGQSIAFRSARDGGGIYVMSATGGEARRLVQGPGWNPSWSPDGNQILYGIPSAGVTPYSAGVGARGLWAADVQTGETRQITTAYAFEPRMSPDGGRVAYWALGGEGAPNAQRDVWTVRADGSEPLRVTNDEAVDWSPVWSPDGAYLYFASDRDGTMKVWRIAIDQVTGVTAGEPELVTNDGGADIRGGLSITAEGTLTYADRNERRTLFRVGLDPAAGTVTTPAPISDPSTLSPSGTTGSPDGQWVAFTRGTVGQEDIFVMRADGSELRPLTDDAYRDRVPTWSPDGTRIAFRSDRPLPDGTRPYRWYRINRDGSDLRPLAEVGATALRWSPDGLRLALHSNGAIGLFDVDGGEPRVVTQTSAADPLTVTIPVWAPDGRRLAYRETKGTRNTIYVLDVTDGSSPRVVHQVDGPLNNPVWSHDSRRLAYRVPGESAGTFVADVTGSGSAPERLPDMDFNPTAWSEDGNLLLGTRPAAGERPAAPLLYDSRTRSYELLAEEGAGGQWTNTGSHVVVTADGGTRLQLIDRATRTVQDLFTVTPPSTFTFGIGADDAAVYYLLSEPQADIFQIRVP
jgi:Tol biopolymer transport system component